MPGAGDQTSLQVAYAIGDAKMIKLLLEYDPRGLSVSAAVSSLSTKEITNKTKILLLNQITNGTIHKYKFNITCSKIGI
jgi:hypothetical protein